MSRPVPISGETTSSILGQLAFSQATDPKRRFMRNHAKYILATKPEAHIAVLYQNDDFGKDYVLAIRDVLGDKFDRMVKSTTYEATDPTIDSQIASLQSVGADVLVVAGIAKFAAQAIRKVYDIGWKPLFFISYVSSSVGMVMKPTGPEKAVGIVTAIWVKDQTDLAWNDDPGMRQWRAFMEKHPPDADLTDSAYVYAYRVSQTMMQVYRDSMRIRPVPLPSGPNRILPGR